MLKSCHNQTITYAAQLRSSTPQGATGHDREAILRSLLAAPLENITTFTALHHRLETDIRFRYQCGFDIRRCVPSVSTLSRVFGLITKKGLAKQLFYDLVQQCYDEEIIIGETIAIDSTAIDAYEKKKPKSKQDNKNATWGAKFDSFGNKLTWFGYKIHLAVDTKSELPVALDVTPAHVNDGDMGPPLTQV
jgi:transposase